MRLSVLALLLLASACAAPSEATSASTADIVTSPPPSLADSVKAAYETHGKSILTNAKNTDWRTLTGDAREAYNEYANTSDWGLINEVGSPIAQTGTFDGVTVLYVAGDLSDTGSEFGFYDENGKTLAVAYEGQGEHPGAGGVDWEK